MTTEHQNNNSNSEETEREKSPAFQFYPKDFLTDAKVMCMSNEVVGMYIKLLCIDWLEDGIWPEQVLRLAGYEGDPSSEEASRAIAELRSCFTIHPDKMLKITNKRLLRERRKQEEKREERRKSGKKGGKAKQKNRLEILAELGICYPFATSKPLAKATSSSSSSSSTPVYINTGNSDSTPPQNPQVSLPIPEVIPAKPAGKRKSIKPPRRNLVDMTEAQLTELGLHPSPQAPKHLTRKKHELIPMTDDGRVWMTQVELGRLSDDLGDSRAGNGIKNLDQYLGIHPDRETEYADHNLTIRNWEDRNNGR